MFVQWCFCVCVVVFLWWRLCGDVFVVVFLCLHGGVVFLWWCLCGDVFVVVFLCLRGGAVVFLWWCFLFL